MEIPGALPSSSSKSNPGTQASRASIFAEYGLGMCDSSRRTSSTCAVDISDTEAEQKPSVEVEWYDAKDSCMKRQLSTGEVVSAKMEAGLSGFLMVVANRHPRKQKFQF